MSEYTNIKSRCPKKTYLMSSKEVAALLQCSQSYVKQVRLEKVNIDTSLAQKIIAIDAIGTDVNNLLIKEVKRIVEIK